MPQFFDKKDYENPCAPPDTDEAAAAKKRFARLPDIATEFGIKAAECPSCGAKLEKFPKRKITCKTCKGSVYPRKNPVTKQVVLISEDDFAGLRELEAYVNGTWEAWFSNCYELDLIRAQLAVEWGLDDASKVPVADAEWRRIIDRSKSTFAASDWPGYMDACAAAIRFLSGERRYADAVPFACEFIYLAYSVDRMQRAYEALGLPEEMRTPLTPPKMHGPQVVMVDMVEPDIDKLRSEYVEKMTQTGLYRLFDMAPEEAFEKYRQERADHYEALRRIGCLEDYLDSIARAQSSAR